nr:MULTISPECIES: phosphotransferase [unclassified Streptomyces]
MLAARYNVLAAGVEPVAEGTETRNGRATLSGGSRVFVKGYLPDADTIAVRSALSLAAYCRDGGVPTPELWVDLDGEVVTWHDGVPWCVMDEADGHPSDSITAVQAESIGTALGLLHRVTADYAGPLRRRTTGWRTGDPHAVVDRCDGLLDRIRSEQGTEWELRREQLFQRRRDLLAHARRVQQGLPAVLADQPLHGDCTRPNILIAGDRVSGIVDFQALAGVPAWELARIAFDPHTTARSDTWQHTTLTMISAYRAENPNVPTADLNATARIALLYLLFSTFGAVPGDLDRPHEAHASMTEYWNDKNLAIARLLDAFDDIETSLRDLLTPHSPRTTTALPPLPEATG